MVNTAQRPATVRGAALVTVASFAGGALTFFAQGVLPDAVASFANSASGWTLVTALLLTWARVRTAVAALLGAVSFALLTLGYSVAASLRGVSYDPTMFVAVGVVVGPFVGVATSWLRADSSWRAAAGTALLAGIGLGEAVYGLTVIAETTSPVYWALIALTALALLLAMLVYRVRGAPWIGLAVIGTAAVAGTFVTLYRTLGGV